MNGLAQRQQARCGEFTLSWREAGHGRPVMLLHGISSGSASWIKQFNQGWPTVIACWPGTPQATAAAYR